MFPTDTTYHGGKVDKEYVRLRAKWETHYEFTQIKGDGETHPYLTPDDEFADYENWDAGNLDITEAKKPEMLQREYAREALKQGLALETATWSNSIGAAELQAIWTDPDFDSKEAAFYHARVLEIPTPRWVVYDKVRLGAKLPKEAELTGQERAYTSPIRHSP
jgi:hypothetical protein